MSAFNDRKKEIAKTPFRETALAVSEAGKPKPKAKRKKAKS